MKKRFTLIFKKRFSVIDLGKKRKIIFIYLYWFQELSSRFRFIMSGISFLNDDMLTEELDHERLDDILIRLEDIKNETNDSYGSCCSSPTESNNSGTTSPSSLTSTDEEPEYFTFAKYPVKKCKPRTKKNADLTNIEKIRQKNETKVKRNIRERMRIKKLQDGFKKLQTVVPGDSKKLSKLDTLKYALEYIKTLTILLQQHDKQMIEQQMQHYQVS